ncbi:uncharacterized protein MONOS_5881 [Monocercomonoides exilis]|uniref:uncharacterized protein n=1 Tax=Monocercomonoides exilis TaxID=2049356 RepID=UPI00355ABC1C|nr:hypothetical protein MONOS_5881 [Monocercomonoides exilis]|eukprot:MONOS_5881.1-p1 / transcript=MONOS_5881.1 / gene=MONOS_5881 / organism=Monocercomonoides_exilis_PA203 / gene_product=unspecified product / transcript_product=unspecified product / location=Mono_scaffold00177:43067-45182(-) / protein_length=584 / sequence_SO=supercontig / SO=protein_coding / is_pseudo=false
MKFYVENKAKTCKAKKHGTKALQHDALILVPFTAMPYVGFEKTVLKIIFHEWKSMTLEEKERMLIALHYYAEDQCDASYGSGRIERRIVKLNGIEEMIDEFIRHLPNDIPSTYPKDTFSFIASIAIGLFSRGDAFETENFRSSHPSFRLLSFTRQWMEFILQQVAQKLNEQEFASQMKEHPSEEEESSGNQFKQELQPSTCCAQNADISQSNLADCEHKADVSSSFNIEREIKSIEMLYTPFQILSFYHTECFMPFLLNHSEDLKRLLLFPERVAALKQERLIKTSLRNSSSSQNFFSHSCSIGKDAFYLEQYSLMLLLHFARTEAVKLCRELFSLQNMLSIARLVCPVSPFCSLPITKASTESVSVLLSDAALSDVETPPSFSSGLSAGTSYNMLLSRLIAQFPGLVPLGALSCLISSFVSLFSGDVFDTVYLQNMLISLRFALKGALQLINEYERDEELEKATDAINEQSFDFDIFREKIQLGKEAPICEALKNHVNSIDFFYQEKLKSEGYSFFELRSIVLDSFLVQIEEQGLEDIFNAIPLVWEYEEPNNVDPFQGVDFTDILQYMALLRTRKTKIFEM